MSFAWSAMAGQLAGVAAAFRDSGQHVIVQRILQQMSLLAIGGAVAAIEGLPVPAGAPAWCRT